MPSADWFQIGLGGLVLAALLTGAKRYWVFGWQFDAMVKERDEWKAEAQRGSRLTETAVDRVPPAPGE